MQGSLADCSGIDAEIGSLREELEVVTKLTRRRWLRLCRLRCRLRRPRRFPLSRVSLNSDLAKQYYKADRNQKPDAKPYRLCPGLSFSPKDDFYLHARIACTCA